MVHLTHASNEDFDQCQQMFAWRNKKNINILWLKRVLCHKLRVAVCSFFILQAITEEMSNIQAVLR